MKCPRCNNATLDEQNRDGIVIDVCPQCRGLWLDRGELERLIARAMDEQASTERRTDFEIDEDHHRDRQHDNHQGPHDRDYMEGRHRKRRWYESLSDMFD
jgi:Zn-finger nucleic acid-binding protein